TQYVTSPLRGRSRRRGADADNSAESCAPQKASGAVGALRANGQRLGGGHADGRRGQGIRTRRTTRVRGPASPNANGTLGGNRGRPQLASKCLRPSVPGSLLLPGPSSARL